MKKLFKKLFIKKQSIPMRIEWQHNSKPIAKVIAKYESKGGLIIVASDVNVVEEKEDFRGTATIKVRFRSLEEYKEFRYKVLKTGWTTEDNYPTYEQLVIPITCYDDVERVAKHIFALLHYGYEVYCCQFKLEKHLQETEHPMDDDEEPPMNGLVLVDS